MGFLRMSRSESMKAYWRHIGAIVKHLGVSHNSARKYYKALRNQLDDVLHAQSDEENVVACSNYDVVVTMMQRYDIYIQSKKRKDI